MTGPGERLMLLDTASLYFRAFFGVPDSLRAPDGSPVNAVRGLLDFVARLVTVHRPTRLVACMDADWRPDFRAAAVPSYKAHRLAPGGGEQVPDELTPQVPVIEAVLDAFGLARVGVRGFEADDVIGTIAARADCPVDVVSGDRDLFQVVDDARGVRVLYTARGVGRLEVVDDGEVLRRYGVPGRLYADFATLRGDPSDGLPGVRGVGEKTAATLVDRFGAVEDLLMALEDPASDLSPTVRARLRAARDYLVVAPAVARVRTDVPLPFYDDRLPTEPADPEALVALSDRWGLDGSVNRVLNALVA
ncbi:MAG TPA: 5'-3' exonuclease [Jiangellales bacterium]|nr:5'-3' exonuclease [Jiangellales bacterium]